ncbi:hypothetical protein J2N67_005981 (plasmid) [Bacillus thuringiensis]|nr:hypothetical protein J2N67_005981 [Bacillus thuringiensis]
MLKRKTEFLLGLTGGIMGISRKEKPKLTVL